MSKQWVEQVSDGTGTMVIGRRQKVQAKEGHAGVVAIGSGGQVAGGLPLPAPYCCLPCCSWWWWGGTDLR